MAHDLIMSEPKKVIAMLDEAIDTIKKVKGTIETTSQIGDMGLKIGGLDTTFKNLEQLNPSMDEAIKVFDVIKDAIEVQAATFKRNNEEISY